MVDEFTPDGTLFRRTTVVEPDVALSGLGAEPRSGTLPPQVSSQVRLGFNTNDTSDVSTRGLVSARGVYPAQESPGFAKALQAVKSLSADVQRAYDLPTDTFQRGCS